MMCDLKKNRTITFIATQYNHLAMVILNVVVFFIILNIIAWLILKISSSNTESQNHVLRQYSIDSLQTVYPNLTKIEIKELLDETWSRPYFYEPFTQFKEQRYDGNYVKVDTFGFRRTTNSEKFPLDTSLYNIFIFGGSTTFGYGVADTTTIVAYLHKKCFLPTKKTIEIYNFGRGFYYSTQERLLFEKLLLQGSRPNLVLFIDGLNDFGFSDAPVFTNKIQYFFDKGGYNQTDAFKKIINELPIIQVLSRNYTKITRTTSEKTTTLMDKNYTIQDSIKAKAVINQYFANKQQIEVLAAFYNIETIFIWQPVPFYSYDIKYHLFAQDIEFRKPLEIGYAMMQKLYDNGEFDEKLIWLAELQKGVKAPLYVDNVHYTAAFSAIIADSITQKIIELNIK